jgi:hypothetical protein
VVDVGAMNVPALKAYLHRFASGSVLVRRFLAFSRDLFVAVLTSRVCRVYAMPCSHGVDCRNVVEKSELQSLARRVASQSVAAAVAVEPHVRQGIHRAAFPVAAPAAQAATAADAAAPTAAASVDVSALNNTQLKALLSK